jgi:excisionase family DNA binding protein
VSEDDSKLLFSIEDLAEQLGVPVGTVRSLRATGRAPTATKVGKRLFFQRNDIDAWLKRQCELDVEMSQPWRESFMPGRIGSSVPRSTAPLPSPLSLVVKGWHARPGKETVAIGLG